MHDHCFTQYIMKWKRSMNLQKNPCGKIWHLHVCMHIHTHSFVQKKIIQMCTHFKSQPFSDRTAKLLYFLLLHFFLFVPTWTSIRQIFSEGQRDFHFKYFIKMQWSWLQFWKEDRPNVERYGGRQSSPCIDLTTFSFLFQHGLFAIQPISNHNTRMHLSSNEITFSIQLTLPISEQLTCHVKEIKAVSLVVLGKFFKSFWNPVSSF